MTCNVGTAAHVDDGAVLGVLRRVGPSTTLGVTCALIGCAPTAYDSRELAAVRRALHRLARRGAVTESAGCWRLR